MSKYLMYLPRVWLLLVVFLVGPGSAVADMLTGNVSLDGATISSDTWWTHGTSSTAALTVTNGLTLGGASTLHVDGNSIFPGTQTVSGTGTIDADSGHMFIGDSLTLGAGITLSNVPNISATTTIYYPDPYPWLVNHGTINKAASGVANIYTSVENWGTIQTSGSGAVIGLDVGVINHGNIQAIGGAGISLSHIVIFVGYGATNYGSLSAQGHGASVDVLGAMQSPGQMTAASEGRVTATLTGDIGSLSVSDKGVMDLTSSSSTPFTLTQPVSVSSSGSLILRGTWGNAASMSINSGAAAELRGAWSNSGSISVADAMLGITRQATGYGSISMTNSTLGLLDGFTVAEALAVPGAPSIISVETGGTLDNTSHVISSDFWRLHGGTITGGVINSGTAPKILNGGTLSSLTIDSDARVESIDHNTDGSLKSCVMTLNNVVNNGTMTLTNVGGLVFGPTSVNNGHIIAPSGSSITVLSPRTALADLQAYRAKIYLDSSLCSWTTGDINSLNSTNSTIYLNGGVFDNRGSILTLDSALGTIALTGGTILGGTIYRTPGKDNPYPSCGQIQDATVNADIVVWRDKLTVTNVQLAGRTIVGGWDYGGLFGELTVADGHLQGNGQVRLAGNSSITSPNGALTIEDGAEIHASDWWSDLVITAYFDRGPRSIGTAGNALTNRGLISLDPFNSPMGPYDVSLYGSSLTNDGTMTASGSGYFNASTATSFRNDGRIVIIKGSKFLMPTLLAGPDSELVLDLGNTIVPLQVSGAVTLDGSLALTLASGYTPKVGDKYTLVTGSSIGGALDLDKTYLQGSLPSTMDVALGYSGTSVWVEVTQVPEPMTVSLLCAAASLAFWRGRR